MFVYGLCSGGHMMKNENVGKGLSLNNDDCIESVKRFCYLGDMLNSGGIESTTPLQVRCAWAKFR